MSDMYLAHRWTGDRAVLEVLSQPIATIAAGVGVFFAAWLTFRVARDNREQAEDQFVRQLKHQAAQFAQQLHEQSTQTQIQLAHQSGQQKAQLEEQSRNLARQLENETNRADRDRRAERANQRLQFYEKTYAEFLHSVNQSFQGLKRSPEVGKLSDAERAQLQKDFQPYADELTRLAGYFKIGESRLVEDRAIEVVMRLAGFYDFANQDQYGTSAQRVARGIEWVGLARDQLEDAMKLHLETFRIDEHNFR